MPLSTTKYPLRDPLGGIIPPGQTALNLRGNFLLSTLPAFLAVASGTPTYKTPLGGLSRLQVSTAATAGSTAKLALSFAIDASQFRGILWELDGVSCDVDSNVTFGMGIAGSGSLGSYVTQGPTSPTASLRYGNPVKDFPLNYNVRGGGDLTRRKNLKLLALPQEGTTYLFENDQVVGFQEGAGTYVAGNVTPDLSITTNEGVSHSLFVSQVSFTLWQN